MEMVEKKSWKEFRNTGLFLFANRFLHLFGWAIVIAIDDTTGEVTEVYPARVKFRGFDPDSEEEAHLKLHDWLKGNINEIHKETFES